MFLTTECVLICRFLKYFFSSNLSDLFSNLKIRSISLSISLFSIFGTGTTTPNFTIMNVSGVLFWKIRYELLNNAGLSLLYLSFL